PGHVFGPLMFGGLLSTWIFGFGLASWYGSRRTEPLPRGILAVLVGATWMRAFVFGNIGLRRVIEIPLGVLVIVPLPFGLACVVYMAQQMQKRKAVPDTTPDKCWKGGLWYPNPNDAALFVGRRDGMGYTWNMAHGWSWVILGSLPVVIGAGMFLMV
ncbi:MAG: DUF5808 domain-containing protein, partial [Acidobacteriota bacterium]